VIPLSDVDRRPVRFPLVTAVIIGINVIVFAIELTKGQAFIIRWSFVPSHIASGGDLITLLTAMFIHGGWLHIGGNMIYIWAFGPEIEDFMGRIRYLIFYLLGGAIASLVQVAANPSSSMPNLGASGAIAAVMGAFLITYPKDRIRTILIIVLFVTIYKVPAALLVGFWFLIQLFSEAGSLVERHGGGIAYMAHIGGFVFGMALLISLRRGRKQERDSIMDFVRNL
jgi:membrane associated rhomboid family serine protease